jgi:hypothetical protein
VHDGVDNDDLDDETSIGVLLVEIGLVVIEVVLVVIEVVSTILVSGNVQSSASVGVTVIPTLMNNGESIASLKLIDVDVVSAASLPSSTPKIIFPPYSPPNGHAHHHRPEANNAYCSSSCGCERSK